VVGTHVARQQITVGPATGTCRGSAAPPPPPPHPPVVVPHVVQQASVLAPQPPPVPAPVAPRPAVHHFFHGVFQNPLVPVVVPPPVPVLAAAPPLTAAGTAAKKEEEREKAFEQSKENSGGQTHHAVAYVAADSAWDARPMATAGAAALGMFVVASAWAATRRRSTAAAIDVRRWE